MKLLSIKDSEIFEKRVLLRLDLDVDEDFTRIELSKDTFDALKEKKCRIIAVGHKGRPEGQIVEKYSLYRLSSIIEKVSGMKVTFCGDIFGQETRSKVENFSPDEIILLENLRSAMSYTNAFNMTEFQRAMFRLQSQAGCFEGKPKS